MKATNVRAYFSGKEAYVHTIPEQRLQQGKDDINELFNGLCPAVKIERRMNINAFIDTYLHRHVAPLIRRDDGSNDYMRHLLTAVAQNAAQNTDRNREDPDYHHALAHAAGRLMQVEKYREAFESVAKSLRSSAYNPRNDLELVKRSKKVSRNTLLQRIDDVRHALDIAARDGVQIQRTKENVPYLYDVQVLASLYRKSLPAGHRDAMPGPAGR